MPLASNNDNDSFEDIETLFDELQSPRLFGTEVKWDPFIVA